MVVALAPKAQLTESEAACLEAVRNGLESKTRIALAIKLDLITVNASLKGLQGAKLVRQRSRRSPWRVTKRGESCAVEIVPDPDRGRRGRPRGTIFPGSAAERLLAALDRPRHGDELLKLLGITRQRLHQLAVRFHADGRVRFGDPNRILHTIARMDDPSVLLSAIQERILSAMPEGFPTTASKLNAVAAWRVEPTLAVLTTLQDQGLVEPAGTTRGQSLYGLTEQGKTHFQRRKPSRTAEPAGLEVRSDRVRSVLSLIEKYGEARARDVGVALGIPRQTLNALMQYLKRKGLVIKAGPTLHSPYTLTPRGLEVLKEMARKDAPAGD